MHTNTHIKTHTHCLRHTVQLQTEHNDLRRGTLLTLFPFVCLCLQATELAALTSKISQLEDAKKIKDEEAQKWQERVRINESESTSVINTVIIQT